MRSLIILILIALAPQTVFANTKYYKCYWTALDGGITDGIMFSLFEPKKEVTYMYGNSDVKSSNYQISEDGNLIGWMNVTAKGTQSYIFDKRVSTFFHAFFNISDAYKGGVNPSTWSEQKCSQQ